MEKKYCIYRHITLNTNRIFYIGIGNIKRPYVKSHRSKYWKNISEKYGYEVEILKSDLLWDDACALEKILISYYGRRDNKTGILCNMTDGGDGYVGGVCSEESRIKRSIAKKGFKHSEETREKFRNKIFTEEHRKNLSNSRKNIKFSEEHKINLSIARKKRITSEETKIKMKTNHASKRPEFCKKLSESAYNCIAVIDLKTNHIYRSIMECAKQLNMNERTLHNQLRGVSKNKTTCKILKNE